MKERGKLFASKQKGDRVSGFYPREERERSSKESRNFQSHSGYLFSKHLQELTKRNPSSQKPKADSNSK